MSDTDLIARLVQALATATGTTPAVVRITHIPPVDHAGSDDDPMTDARTCPITGEALTADRYVSRTACRTLASLLVDLGALMGDLDAALGRQLHFGERVGGRTSGATALPYAPGASEAGWIARQTVLAWVDWVAAVRGHTTPDHWNLIGVYLRAALGWVAAHPDGPQCVDELTAALRQARRAIDRPAERRYAGICGGVIVLDVTTMTDADPVVLESECTTRLYAYADADAVTCPVCGTVWPVQARRDDMLTKIRDVTLTATQLSRAVDGLGVDLTPERVRKWAQRGLITAVPAQDRGAPVYRVGDALDIVAGRTGVTVA